MQDKKKNPLSSALESLYNQARSFLKVFTGRAGLTIKGDFSPARKVLLTYVVIAVVLSGIAFYMIGSAITAEALMKQIDSVNAQLSERSAALAKIEADLEASNDAGKQLSSTLNTTRADLASTQSTLAFVRNAMSNTQTDLTNCQSTGVALRANVSSLQNASAYQLGVISSCQGRVVDLNATVSNSVAAVCCSYGDVQAGISKNWQITNNRIVCAGSGTVNCTSGTLS
jgi:septal ring factor EnvC (AmiA/AmiB activator)